MQMSADCLRISSAERHLGALVDWKLNKTQQRSLAAQQINFLGLYQ